MSNPKEAKSEIEESNFKIIQTLNIFDVHCDVKTQSLSLVMLLSRSNKKLVLYVYMCVNNWEYNPNGTCSISINNIYKCVNIENFIISIMKEKMIRCVLETKT